MNDYAYRQCTRCVMDTSDPQIYFDEKGRCNHCTKLLQLIQEPGYKARFNDQGFQRLVDVMKREGKNRKYDCVLGISGGADSCYLAYLLKQKGLRVLLVHLDNGWNAEESVRNIKAVVDCLEFDYEAVVLDWEEFKDIQRSFLKASVVEVETPTDIAILGALHKKAAQHGVRYVVSGGNLATEGILPHDWHYDAKDLRYLLAIQSQFGRKKLRSLPTFSYWQEALYKLVYKIRIVYPLNYISFNKEEAIGILEREMEWRRYGGKHYESRYTKFVQSYLLPLKFGIDYRKATFSSQICFGDLTREEALAKLKQSLYREEDIEREKSFIAKKLDFTRSELDAIIALPPKSFRDYPNNQKKLLFLYGLYRRLTNKNS